MSEIIDQAREVRAGEELDRDALQTYLFQELGSESKIVAIQQFPSGYSNLTYLIQLTDIEIVLRKPPIGANIKTAHDMSREVRVLRALAPSYSKVPKVLAFCEQEQVLGAPFYLMERLTGIILRNKLPQYLMDHPQKMNAVSLAVVDNLVELHQLPLDQALAALGKPEGYVQRQIEGWTKRYRACQSEEIKGMEMAMDALSDHQPAAQAAFIHNDYKYDNIMLDPQDWQLLAVLDWEMATVGHPLLDLGTSLGYWAESQDHPALKPFSLTWQPGNLNRQQVLDRYFDQTDQQREDILPYYVFGCFKIGVIVQQIYARYLKGITKDPRFAGLGHVVQACGQNIEGALKFNRISSFNKMKAIRINQIGGPEVLNYEEVSDPVCGTEEVLVSIKSISVNFSDVLIRRGEYPYMPAFPAILGSESAGEVLQVGSNVKDIKPGERVIVFGHPSYCTLAAVPASKVVPFPDNVSFDSAAALPIIYLTAYHMLHTVRRVKPGETVLIYAAAGGVGTATIQLGKIAQLKMIGLTSQDEKADIIKEMGIDHVINYRMEPVVERVKELTNGRGADLILDCIAGENFGDNFKMLNTLGQVIWFGIADGNPSTDLLRALGRDPSQSYGVSMFHLFSIMKNPRLMADSFSKLIEYLASGKIDPIIYRKIPLEEAHQAHQILEDHENTGKVILNP